MSAQNGLTIASSDIHIIPKLVSVIKEEGSFQLNETIRIIYRDKRGQKIADRIVEKVKSPTGFHLLVERNKESKTKNALFLKLNKKPDKELDSAGYILQVGQDQVVLKANTVRGLFYGIQTLFQLLPPAIESDSVQSDVDWEIPCVKIVDYPKFS